MEALPLAAHKASRIRSSNFASLGRFIRSHHAVLTLLLNSKVVNREMRGNFVDRRSADNPAARPLSLKVGSSEAESQLAHYLGPQKSIDPSTSEGFFSNARQIARKLSMLGKLAPRSIALICETPPCQHR